VDQRPRRRRLDDGGAEAYVTSQTVLESGGGADLGPPPPLVADAWTFGEGARVPAVDVDSAGSAVDDVNFLEGIHNNEADDADEAESETVPTLRLEFGDEGDDANDADAEAAPTPRVR